jgi:hypothetical protein
MIRKLFIAVDPQLSDDNLDFEFLTDLQIEEAEKEHETVYEYLSSGRMYESWFEIACSKQNIIKLQELVEKMRKELEG